MKQVEVKPNQTIYDIAVQHYGNCGAVGEILDNNPAIRNDPAAQVAMGIDSANTTDLYLDIALEPRQLIAVDENSQYMKPNIIKELTIDVTTFDLQ